MKAPVVSAVVAGYNAERVVSAGLRSLLDQPGVRHEVIFVDDGSTDRTIVLVQALMRDHPNLVLIKNTRQGLTRSLIDGCDAAKGRYILRQDVAMLATRERTVRQARVLDASDDVVLVTGWCQLTDPDLDNISIIRNDEIEPEHRKAFSWAVRENQNCRGVMPTAHGSVMFRKSAYEQVGGYRDAFRYAQDTDLWLRLCEIGRFMEIEELLCVRPVLPSGNSMSRRTLQEQLGRLAHQAAQARRAGLDEGDVLGAAQRLSDLALNAEQVDVGAKELTAGYYFLGACMARTNPSKARVHLRRVLRDRPMHLKALAQYIRTWVPVA